MAIFHRFLSVYQAGIVTQTLKPFRHRAIDVRTGLWTRSFRSSTWYVSGGEMVLKNDTIAVDLQFSLGFQASVLFLFVGRRCKWSEGCGMILVHAS